MPLCFFFPYSQSTTYMDSISLCLFLPPPRVCVCVYYLTIQAWKLSSPWHLIVCVCMWVSWQSTTSWTSSLSMYGGALSVEVKKLGINNISPNITAATHTIECIKTLLHQQSVLGWSPSSNMSSKSYLKQTIVEGFLLMLRDKDSYLKSAMQLNSHQW